MSLGLGEITTQAHERVAAGDLAGARELLDPALASADPSPAHASPELAEAAGLHARILVALGEAAEARPWAAFAYSATTRLHGSDDERTIAAGALLAAVLHRVGSHARAAHLYRGVITELTAIDGPESLRVLAAHADLATVEHARGDCTVAHDRLEDAWELHREVYGDGHPSGIRMLARLGAMERDCGRTAESGRHLVLAEELCRRHLPPGHPLAAQVAALAAGGADPEHDCGDGGPTPRQAGPDTPPAAGATGAGIRPPPVPPPRTSPEGSPDSPLFEDDYADLREPWWPPEHAEPASDDLPDALKSPTPPQPPTGSPAGDSDTWRGRAAADPLDEPGEWDGVRGVGQFPGRPQDDDLPPRVHHPPRRPRQNLLPIIIAGLVVVLLSAVAVVAGLTLIDGAGRRPNSPSAGPSPTTASPTTAAPATATPTAAAAPRPALPGAPPTGVALRDTGDSVALTWTYPAGAEAPVVISGSRAGLPPRAFQQLPAGASSFIVYGLDRNTDYCFAIAVVYATDQVGRSGNVCTARSRATPRN